MTIVVAWERGVGPLRELIVASDSRLSVAETERWDGCPKVFTFPGFPFILAFRGSTGLAYPYVLQAIAQLQGNEAVIRRATDIADFSGHVARTTSSMRLQVSSPDVAYDPSECELLIGGWSWRLGRFRVFVITFDKNSARYVAVPAKPAPLLLGGASASSVLAVIGDPKARSALVGELAKRSDVGPLGYTPLEAIWTLCGRKWQDTVGGVPQVAKAYQSMHVEPFSVSVDAESPHMCGRRLLPGESNDLRVIERGTDGDWRVEEKERVAEIEQATSR